MTNPRTRTARLLVAAALVVAAASCSSDDSSSTRATTSTTAAAADEVTADDFTVEEFPITYPARTDTSAAAGEPAPGGSTHEITFDHGAEDPTELWITDQNSDSLVRMALDGTYEVFPMPAGSGPHGSAFDDQHRLWLTLQSSHQVVRVDEEGRIQQTFDLTEACDECADVPPGPHGLAFGPDGETLWYAAKDGGYIGVIHPDGTQDAFPLPDPSVAPIYVWPGPDGNMWFTEYKGNQIGRITPDGEITELAIPTPDSGPIAIRPGPDGESMWFTEEYGSRMGRIDLSDDSITEYEIPRSQDNLVLAAFAFDDDGNLWVQQWIDLADPDPAAADRILRVDASFVDDPVSPVPLDAITDIEVPSRLTGMHRLIVGPDDAIWFTELNLDTVGKVTER